MDILQDFAFQLHKHSPGTSL